MVREVCSRLTYANVVATLAMVFAMSGGAYAASKYLIVSTKQIKPSVLKQLQGKAGTTGPAGAPGATGSAGPVGPTGAKGADGANGTNGAPGTNGTSVTSSVEKAGANCKAGGSKFVAASGTTYACNGENGSPWTAGGTLPPGASETGVWSLTGWWRRRNLRAHVVPGSARAALEFLAGALRAGKWWRRMQRDRGKPDRAFGKPVCLPARIEQRDSWRHLELLRRRSGSERIRGTFFEGVSSSSSGLGTWAVTG